ncbi:ribosomal maturation YjgA family protein [Streptococcus fryi]
MKKRIYYFAWLLLVIILGLISRKIAILPLFIGDSLWAIAVYLGWRLWFPYAPIRYICSLALLSSFIIEFSQLLMLDWLISLRQTRLGYLLLGQGFLVEDLFAYGIGIALIGLLDYKLLKHVLFKDKTRIKKG